MTRTRLLIVLAALLVGRTARADGVAQILTAKTLPPATVAVIDPETGSSSGGGTTDVKVAVGDVILFRFEYYPVPDKIVHGLEGYLTEYIPANTEVVGVRLIDENGVTIEPRYPGIATDGCGRPCNGFNSVPSSGGPRNLADGSIAQVYADTGVFYTTDARLGRVPSTAFLSLTNGTLMSPQPQNIGAIIGILGASAPIYAHNGWDWIQERAYGIPNSGGNASGNNGTGNTPYRYGSPVAGPLTWYRYEATEPSPGVVQFNDVDGPWQRVVYPGAQIGTGAAVTGSGPLLRVNVDTAAGYDVKPATPLPAGTRAVRLALGEVRVGEPGYAEIALRVTGTPIDPIQGRDVDCAEVFGGDTSAASDTVRAKDALWPTYLGSPACVYLNLLFDLDVDRKLAVVGDTLTYTLHGKNLSINPQTNVVRKMKYDATRVSYVAGSATGAPSLVPGCDGDGLACLVWPTVTLAPSEEYTFTARFTVGGGGHVTNVQRATYASTQLPGGFGVQSITMVKQVAVPGATLATTTLPYASAGGTAAFSGTISNTGSGDAAFDDMTIVLPPGWTITGSVAVGSDPSLTCVNDCGTSRPTYRISQTLAGGESRALTFTALIPGGTATGLYDIDLQIWASQSAFGGNFETYFPDLAAVAVGAARSAPPVVTCPVVHDATTVSGTTIEAAGTTIRLYFNLIQRGSAPSGAGGAWTVGTFGAGSPFGALYGGLEIRATAQAAGELESELSSPCVVTTVSPCRDFLDNDGDGLVDYPADPGCDAPGDTSEADPILECSDGLDNDGDSAVDFPADLGCYAPLDRSESSLPQCSDGVDDDGDGLIDYPADPDCTGAGDPSEARLDACQDWTDNDGDGRTDFPADPGCHSPNDDSEADLAFTPSEVRARLLIAFDTSGSMNWNTCDSTFTGGDGSAACGGVDVNCATCSASGCGDGFADDSRLYKVKDGLSDVVAAFGEVDYGLMRFHQRSIAFACPTQNASLGSGGWQGAGPAPCAGGFNAGDLLVSFGPDNQYDLLEYMDGQTNYAGTPPAGLDTELRGSGTTPLGGILTSAQTYLSTVRGTDPQGGCRPYRVILVTDGAETCGGDPVSAAGVLAAAGVPVHVIGFATSDPTIVANLNAIAAAGGTGTAVRADDSVTLSTALASIVTDTILVELCNGADDDCDGLIDEDFPDKGTACTNGLLGACFRTGTRICRVDGLGTQCTAPVVTGTPEVCNGLDDDCNGLVDDGIPGGCGPCVPGSEICNGVDDDCDGAIDEAPMPGVGDPCGVDTGACAYGTLACVAGGLTCVGGTGPSAELCNNADDDCDGVTDSFSRECYTFPTGCTLGAGCTGTCRTGVETCTAGAFGACAGQVGPVAERCNGLDDDCDGLIDEDFPLLGTACDNGLSGECRTTGTYQCTADGSGVFCTAAPISSGAEVCNGADDDCDGLIDEDPLPPPVGNDCGGGGACLPGRLECVGGMIECIGGTSGSAEVCNGIDDDCDGFIDEPVLPGIGLECTDPGFELIGDTGECEYGLLQCVGGAAVCVGYVGPRPEICNGLDDDCDGTADDFALCPDPMDLCVDTVCAPPCDPTIEFDCGFGFRCEALPDGTFCLPDPCYTVICPPGTFCDQTDSTCKDPCDIVSCLPGETCDDGQCLDCFELGCPAGQVCVTNLVTGVGACEDDPCAAVTCPVGQFCQDGECTAIDCVPACPARQVCENGDCVDNCGALDRCSAVTCQPGWACHPATGTCTPDPCITSACPAGYACSVGCEGQSVCDPPPPEPGIDILAAGAGCGCRAGGAGGAPGGSLAGGLLALLGLAQIVRRRKRS